MSHCIHYLVKERFVQDHKEDLVLETRTTARLGLWVTSGTCVGGNKRGFAGVLTYRRFWLPVCTFLEVYSASESPVFVKIQTAGLHPQSD